MQVLTEMLNSIITYFSALNWEELLASFQLVLSNINFETFRDTLEVLKGFLSSISSLLG